MDVFVPYSAAGVSTSIVITSRFTGKMMLLDVGDGTLRDLLTTTQGTKWVHEIDLIALSHGHFDHIGGLHSLLGFLRLLKRKSALNILVPQDCREAIGVIKGFQSHYTETLPYNIRYHEMSDGSGFDTDFFKVNAIAVEHSEREFASITGLQPALGFRVTIGSTLVGYTGDTRMCTGAKDVVRNADLAIVEATARQAPDEGQKVHLTEDEALELAKMAKEHLLIHRIPRLDV